MKEKGSEDRRRRRRLRRHDDELRDEVAIPRNPRGDVPDRFDYAVDERLELLLNHPFIGANPVIETQNEFAHDADKLAQRGGERLAEEKERGLGGALEQGELTL